MTDQYTPFAGSGQRDTDAAIESVADAGLEAERVRYKLFNKLFNRVDRAVNEILAGGLKGLSADGADLNHIQRLYPPGASSYMMDDAINVLRANTGGEEYHTEMCVYHSDGVKYLIALELQGYTVDVFNLTTKVRTQHDLSSTLPAASGDWQPVSVCTDNEFAYVLFADTSGSYTRRVHSYDLSDWSVNSAWSASYDCGTGLSDPTLGNVIICADGLIAVNRSWVQVVTSCIYILDTSDGSLAGGGNGDTTLGASDYTRSCIASDGTYVYFAVDDNAAGPDQLCSMSIASGAVGCGGAGWPLTTGVTYDILAAQGKVVSTTFNGTFIATPAVADSGTIADDETFLENAYQSGLGFDGQHFWQIGTNHTSNISFVTRLTMLPAVVDGADYNFGEPIFPCFALSQTASAVTPPSKLIFDGCDFWFVANGGSGGSGIFRFPKPLIR
jgi:hypothetical protein